MSVPHHYTLGLSCQESSLQCGMACSITECLTLSSASGKLCHNIFRLTLLQQWPALAGVVTMSAVPQSSTPISKETLLEDIPTPDIVAPLFEPITVGRFELKTRAVYCPLTRCRSPGAIAQPEAAVYYSGT